MQQLGVQVAVQPTAVGPVRFGVCTSVRSDNPAPPGAATLTMIEARTDDEVLQIRETSRRIMLQLRGMPGFLSFQGAVIGRRLTTVTLWESREAQRQVMREANAAGRAGAGGVSVWGGGGHAKRSGSCAGAGCPTPPRPKHQGRRPEPSLTQAGSSGDDVLGQSAAIALAPGQ